MLRVAHEIPDTDAEGPGRRHAVWLQGCPLRCAGCCNPELFDVRGGILADPHVVAARILASDVDGVTVLGGEPFAQPEGLAALLRAVRAGGRSTIVFSGYTLEELQALPGTAPALAELDVLVDGRYDAARPETRRRWIGSKNQRLWFFTDRYGPADFEGANTVELRWDGKSLTVSGWPDARIDRRKLR